MKKITFIFTLIFFTIAVFAQVNTKKTNFYKESEISPSGDIKLSVKNPVSKFNYAKFELIIQNQSKDFVYFKQSECIFKYEKGEYKPEDKKPVIVFPDAEKSPTLKVEGGNEFLADKFEFIPGGFYTFSSSGNSVAAPEFHLPVNKNDFSAGNFSVKMLKLKKETAETAVQFEVVYNGDKQAIVFPSKAVIRTADGTEWANARSHEKPEVLENGGKCKFSLIFNIPGKVVDMQFAVMDIEWKDVFVESELKPIEFKSNTIVIDEGKTAAKNK